MTAPDHRRALSYVTEPLTAHHRDHLLQEGRHQHTWMVTAYYPSEPFRDMRSQKAALRLFLDALPDANDDLPAELWSGEAIARAVLVLASCVGAKVERAEGYGAEVWA